MAVGGNLQLSCKKRTSRRIISRSAFWDTCDRNLQARLGIVIAVLLSTSLISPIQFSGHALACSVLRSLSTELWRARFRRAVRITIWEKITFPSSRCLDANLFETRRSFEHFREVNHANPKKTRGANRAIRMEHFKGISLIGADSETPKGSNQCSNVDLKPLVSLLAFRSKFRTSVQVLMVQLKPPEWERDWLWGWLVNFRIGQERPFFPEKGCWEGSRSKTFSLGFRHSPTIV